MAILNKKDLRGLFIMLALLFLFDSLLGGFWWLGIIIFLVLVILVLLSDRPEGMSLEKHVGTRDNEILMRVAIILTFVGVLAQNGLVIALGFIIGAVLLFSPVDSFTLDLYSLTLKNGAAQKPLTPASKSKK